MLVQVEETIGLELVISVAHLFHFVTIISFYHTRPLNVTSPISVLTCFYDH